MKSLIAVRVLFTLVSTTAFAQQERLAHLAETLELSTGNSHKSTEFSPMKNDSGMSSRNRTASCGRS